MIVNGEKLHLKEHTELSSLQDLILHFQLHPEAVAVEINGEILQRQNWNKILLKEEDQIELIRFVGGG